MTKNLNKLSALSDESITVGLGSFGTFDFNNTGRITNDTGKKLKVTALELEAWMSTSSVSAAGRVMGIFQAGSAGRFDFQSSYAELMMMERSNPISSPESRQFKVIGNYIDTLFEFDTFNAQQTAEASEEGQIFLNARFVILQTEGGNNMLGRFLINLYYKN